ncbi:MAG: hypothetical protein ACLFTZ_02370 [Acholeplasmataceae bacterium]
MFEDLIYFTSLLIFFAINLRVLRALHIEKKFEKMKIWEIKTAYFLVALVVAHLLAEIMERVSSLASM